MVCRGTWARVTIDQFRHSALRVGSKRPAGWRTLVITPTKPITLSTANQELKCEGNPEARKVLGWPKRYQLAHAFLWEYSYKRLRLAQLLSQ
jgi:hypothetical protein